MIDGVRADGRERIVGEPPISSQVMQSSLQIAARSTP